VVLSVFGRSGPGFFDNSKHVVEGDTDTLHQTKRVEVCQLHNIPLQLGFAEIAYGLLAIDDAYFEDKPHLFPHSKAWVAGGCVFGNVHATPVDYCPECREAEVVWHQVKKLLHWRCDAFQKN
jgi:hypothetical protein